MQSRARTARDGDSKKVRARVVGVKRAPAEGKYVYSIIESRDQQQQSFGKIGIGGRGDDVYTVHFRDLAAVVSDTPIAIHDPTRENVLGHERVIEAIMERHSVLPMSFSTVFRTRDDVVEFLKDTHDALKEVLAQVRGKIEFGVQVNWDREAVVRDIEARDEASARLALETNGAYDLVLTDLRLADGDGLSIARQLQETGAGTPVIVLTGFGSLDSAVEAMHKGVYDYLLKPCDVEELKETVRRALERSRLTRGLRERDGRTTSSGHAGRGADARRGARGGEARPGARAGPRACHRRAAP